MTQAPHPGPDGTVPGSIGTAGNLPPNSRSNGANDNPTGDPTMTISTVGNTVQFTNIGDVVTPDSIRDAAQM